MNTLSRSVGSGGANNSADAKLVQLLLNNWLRSSQQAVLRLDGLVGPKTIGAITSFQKKMRGVPDGRVDPNGPTIKALIALQTEHLFDGVATENLNAAVRRLRIASPGFSAPSCQADLYAAINEYFLELKRVL